MTNHPNRNKTLERLSEDQLRRKLFKVEEGNPYRSPGAYSAIENASKSELIDMWIQIDDARRDHDHFHDLECKNAALAAVTERSRKHR